MPALKLVDEPLSPARTQLAAAINAHGDASATPAQITQALVQLDRAKADEAAALVDIADLDAIEDSALKAWSLNPTGDAPTPDTAKREALTAKLELARSTADAARRIQDELREDHTAAVKSHATASTDLNDAAAAVILEELEALDRQLAADVAAIETRILTQLVAASGLESFQLNYLNRNRAKALAHGAERMMDRGRLFWPSVTEANTVQHPLRSYYDALHSDVDAEMPSLTLEK